MHPDPVFRMDADAVRSFVADHSFGALFAGTAAGQRVVHLPVVWLDGSRLGLHLSRRNLIGPDLDGAAALFVAGGPHAYVSPDWYGLGPGEVPTWNYAAAEVEGRLERMDEAGLIDQIDRLVAAEEAALAPKLAWTRAGLDEGRFRAMLDGIVGYTLHVAELRGTFKMNQNKPAAARLSAAAALEARGEAAVAARMRTLTA